MSLGKIQGILCIAEKLSPELLARVGKGSTTSLDHQEDDLIPVKTAEMLAKLPREEQVAMAPTTRRGDVGTAQIGFTRLPAP